LTANQTKQSTQGDDEPTTTGSIMAGLGRRTHYRKHLTDQVLFDLPVPDKETDQVGKIVATRGSNQFDVLLSDGANSKVLAILPTKYRKLVWLKRNDFVIVESGLADGEVDSQESEASGTADELTTGDNDDVPIVTRIDDSTGGGIRYMIKHILYKEQIRNLIEKGFWPDKDPEFQTEVSSTWLSSGEAHRGAGADNALPTAAADGIVYEADYNEEECEDDDDDDADLFVNTNRVAAIKLEDSSSSDDEEM
jgi:probable RNA-binding protein EIF1AD